MNITYLGNRDCLYSSDTRAGIYALKLYIIHASIRQYNRGYISGRLILIIGGNQFATFMLIDDVKSCKFIGPE